MAARKLPEVKAADAIIDACADNRLNEVAFAHIIMEEAGYIQRVFYNLLIGYIYAMATNYEYGVFANDTYDIARVCKKIKDLVLMDEYPTPKYERYGDYEKAREVSDLTPYDSK